MKTDTQQPLSLSVTLPVEPDAAIARVTEALKTEGFGVLTTIDVQATMRAKLNIAFSPYTILGACNPQLAHKALDADPAVGLMLPCNVVVRAVPEGSQVEIANPLAMLTIMSNDTIAAVADEAMEKLERVAAALRAS